MRIVKMEHVGAQFLQPSPHLPNRPWSAAVAAKQKYLKSVLPQALGKCPALSGKNEAAMTPLRQTLYQQAGLSFAPMPALLRRNVNDRKRVQAKSPQAAVFGENPGGERLA
jgi:hypothetical protein